MTDFEATLVWTVRCNCGRIDQTPTVTCDWFGLWNDEDLDSTNAVETLELQGWSFFRESYEVLKPICPECTEKAK